MPNPKYSITEFERRWLVKSSYAVSLRQTEYKKIDDLYLTCGRLRLRAITDSQTGKLEFKFCKKYGSISTTAEPIVNIYLSIEEYSALLTLPGHKVTKRRYKKVIDGFEYSFDVFEGDLSGLIICEIEAENEVSLNQIPNPEMAVKEVTGNPEFSGGKLCLLHPAGILNLLNG